MGVVLPEDIIETDVDGRTMYIQRSKMGDLVTFQALVPDFESAGSAWLVIAGVTAR